MRAAIYARVSKRDSSQDTDNQILQLRDFRNAHGYQPAAEYIEHESGARPDRPAFTRMMQDARRRRFDVLLFWSLDRLSREGARQTLAYLQHLTDAGVKFRSYTEQYLDSCGVFSEAVIAILAVIAKQERIRLSERTRAGMERARAQGSIIGRPSVTDSQSYATIHHLWAAGTPVREIAEKITVSEATIRRVLKKTATLL